MNKISETVSAGVDRLPSQPRALIVSEELAKVTAVVADACPSDARISFLYDGRLHLMIDVRTLEEVLAVEMILPKIGAGMFHDVARAQAPRHGFGHRVTALVDR
jgi:hypothetical protein